MENNLQHLVANENLAIGLSPMNPITPRNTPNQGPNSAMKTFSSTPNLATAERAAKRAKHQSGEKPMETATPRTFARPINYRFLESPTVGVKKEVPQSPTRPKEFTFRTATRALLRGKAESDTEQDEVKPKRFKAIPCSTDNPGRPPFIRRPPTVPIPFRLRTDEIDRKYGEKMQKKVEDEGKQRRNAFDVRDFMPDLARPVIIPLLVDSRTVQDNVQMDMDGRADEPGTSKQNENLRRQKLDKNCLEEEENRERAQTVYRAQPIKKFKPIEIKHDFAQITVPHSPKFETDRRLLERHTSRNGLGSQKK